MPDYRLEATVQDDGTLFIKGLPFQAGDRVEVIIRRHEGAKPTETAYPLRGTPVRLTDPFESVAEDDWEALR